jgi:hypothetical protein
MKIKISLHLLRLISLLILLQHSSLGAELKRLQYNNPGLIVDLGVGLWAWPLPMDFDEDGDYDLVVVCPDQPFNGTYFFENKMGKVTYPVFEPPVRISQGDDHVQVSYVNGEPRVLSPGIEHVDFKTKGIDTGVPLSISDEAMFQPIQRSRAKQWKYLDYDGDGLFDIVAGYDEWEHYGWDDAFSDEGVWTSGPLRGYVVWSKNIGSHESPVYDEPQFIYAEDAKVEVYGWPSPNFADFDADGDLDLICGEFLDSFTYFENIGSRTDPVYTSGRQLKHRNGILKMDLQMIIPVAIDWDKDGDTDLICGDEDGRVALIEHTGEVVDGLPLFERPVYFQQRAQDVKFGALATPFGVDWDQDGDEDIICGNTAGHIGFFENIGGDEAPVWDRVQLLKAAGRTIRIQAGPNGSIQGPAEAKWGYTTQTIADWDHDGLPDIIVNSIWGKIVWYRNIGVVGSPLLDDARPITVAWPGETPKPAWNWWDPVENELVSQWRTTPVAVDWNRDGLMDLVMIDHEGELAFFERVIKDGRPVVMPGKRIFTDENGDSLDLVWGPAGKSGRRKIEIVDWDGDGLLDFLFNGVNADFYRNIGSENGQVLLKNEGPLDGRKISGHTSSPTVVDWDKNGIPDLLVGSEDGRLYYKKNPRALAE